MLVMQYYDYESEYCNFVHATLVFDILPNIITWVYFIIL